MNFEDRDLIVLASSIRSFFALGFTPSTKAMNDTGK